MQRQYIVKLIGNVSDWLSYGSGTFIKVTDSAGCNCNTIISLIFVIFPDYFRSFLNSMIYCYLFVCPSIRLTPLVCCVDFYYSLDSIHYDYIF